MPTAGKLALQESKRVVLYLYCEARCPTLRSSRPAARRQAGPADLVGVKLLPGHLDVFVKPRVVRESRALATGLESRSKSTSVCRDAVACPSPWATV